MKGSKSSGSSIGRQELEAATAGGTGEGEGSDSQVAAQFANRGPPADREDCHRVRRRKGWGVHGSSPGSTSLP